ncbi:D-inositol 3-phosphate glycosyltransferase [Pirellula sp. SH-Sr6A]|uniref:glycosyltransferase family 4 protein n=1 Tax=Pirellula sp. SH-Sr6A TaxID=1632865 RepID=UPI00078D41DB|nr:glycosyltransferase family 4 protein [Pirellula sp. SH-Sr6A]AMV32000.1 D-inositol 3-phosphate glycosyltransferase [Pirellula sp. SH-Sr6A]
MDHSQPLGSRSNTPPVRVLVVGQTPPPFHGQAIMIQMLVEGPLPDVEIHHVRMQFSESLGEIGKVRIGKIWHLFELIARIVWCRIRFRPTILYYPPAGPNFVPLVRDAVLLFFTRWLFPTTVFHFQAAGCSELISQLKNPWKWWIRRALGAPDVAIELSEYGPPDGATLGAKRIVYIPNASKDEAHKFPRDRQVDAIQPSRILYLGTVTEEKGVSVLLDACRILLEAQTPFRLDIVGGFGSEMYRQQLEQDIASKRLQEHVTMHGQKVGQEKWNMFAQADIFCFPSYYRCESFGCVLVEAMTFSLPVVSTRWRGIPTIVSHGKNGFLAPTQDANAVAEFLTQLVNSPELRRMMGTEGRRRFEQEFTQEIFLERMRSLFLSLA